MAVKSFLGRTGNDEKLYPKLMVCCSNGQTTVVHFEEPNSDKGIQVYSTAPENKRLQLRETSGWQIDKFVDFNESVILKNE